MIYIAFASQQDRVTIWTWIKQKIQKVKIVCQINFNAVCPPLKSTGSTSYLILSKYISYFTDILSYHCSYFVYSMLIYHRYCSIDHHCRYLVGSSRALFDQSPLLVPCGSFIDHTITKLFKIDIKMSVFVENESPVQSWFIFDQHVMQIQWNSWAQHTKFHSNDEMPIRILVIDDPQSTNNDDWSNNALDDPTRYRQWRSIKQYWWWIHIDKNNSMTKYLQSIKSI